MISMHSRCTNFTRLPPPIRLWWSLWTTRRDVTVRMPVARLSTRGASAKARRRLRTRRPVLSARVVARLRLWNTSGRSRAAEFARPTRPLRLLVLVRVLFSSRRGARDENAQQNKSQRAARRKTPSPPRRAAPQKSERNRRICATTTLPHTREERRAADKFKIKERRRRRKKRRTG